MTHQTKTISLDSTPVPVKEPPRIQLADSISRVEVACSHLGNLLEEISQGEIPIKETDSPPFYPSLAEILKGGPHKLNDLAIQIHQHIVDIREILL